MADVKFCASCGNSCLKAVVVCNKCGGKSFSSKSLGMGAKPVGHQESVLNTKSPRSSYGNTRRSPANNVFGWLGRNRDGGLFIVLGVIFTLAIVFAVSFGGKPKFSGNVETLERGFSGHFQAKVWINGTPIKMLVDTGATKVSLSLKEAAKAGVTKAQLGKIRSVQTANGTARVAEVVLKQVRLGSIVAKDVEAWVMLSKNPGEIALLGMSFLNQLSSWSRSGSTLTLEP